MMSGTSIIAKFSMSLKTNGNLMKVESWSILQYFSLH